MAEHAFSAETGDKLGAPPPSQAGSRGGVSWRLFQGTKLYDLLAAAPLIAWYAMSVWQRLSVLAKTLSRTPPAGADAKFLLDMLAQFAGIVLFVALMAFLLIRAPAKAKMPGLMPRLTALAGTYFASALSALPRAALGPLADALSLVLILGGLSFAAYGLLYLGRSFSLMPEARRLVTGGPYAVVRHPLYVGEAAATIGLMLQYLSPLAFLVVAVQLGFQMQRVLNEERILGRQFPGYRAYAARSARFFPGLF